MKSIKRHAGLDVARLSIAETLRLFQTSWRLILVIPVLVAIVAYLIAAMVPPTYNAEARLTVAGWVPFWQVDRTLIWGIDYTDDNSDALVAGLDGPTGAVVRGFQADRNTNHTVILTASASSPPAASAAIEELLNALSSADREFVSRERAAELSGLADSMSQSLDRVNELGVQIDDVHLRLGQAAGGTDDAAEEQLMSDKARLQSQMTTAASTFERTKAEQADVAARFGRTPTRFDISSVRVRMDPIVDALQLSILGFVISAGLVAGWILTFRRARQQLTTAQDAASASLFPTIDSESGSVDEQSFALLSHVLALNARSVAFFAVGPSDAATVLADKLRRCARRARHGVRRVQDTPKKSFHGAAFLAWLRGFESDRASHALGIIDAGPLGEQGSEALVPYVDVCVLAVVLTTATFEQLADVCHELRQYDTKHVVVFPIEPSTVSLALADAYLA